MRSFLVVYPIAEARVTTPEATRGALIRWMNDCAVVSPYSTIPSDQSVALVVVNADTVVTSATDLSPAKPRALLSPAAGGGSPACSASVVKYGACYVLDVSDAPRFPPKKR